MASLASICSSRTQGVSTRAQSRQAVVTSAVRPVAVWTRPTPDRDADFIKPSYIPTPIQPSITPGRQDSPIYAPVTPEFRPAELPETPKELPNAPRLPERRPDDIPAGNPKEKPGQQGTPDQREAPPSKDRESAPKK